MKKLISMIICVVFCLQMVGCGTNQTVSELYEKVSESQKLLDAVADDIYSYWYDAIYEDEYSGSIDLAIAYAQVENEENLEKIEALDAEIAALFKEAKDSKQGELVKEVMSAYSDYYEFVVNVSGSFKSYSADKETLKKELASLLRDLSYEL